MSSPMSTLVLLNRTSGDRDVTSHKKPRNERLSWTQPQLRISERRD